MGRRISKSVNGIVAEKYLWQDSTTLLAVLDASGNVVQRFEYADGRMPVAMTYQGAVYYFGYDQVGSLRVVTDSAGNIVKRVDYDSFGNILSDSNPSLTVPFGFAGGLHDRDTGLVRFGARDYDPATGKWTAKDPIDFASKSINLLDYCFSDPVNITDSNGLIVGSILSKLGVNEAASLFADLASGLLWDIFGTDIVPCALKLPSGIFKIWAGSRGMFLVHGLMTGLAEITAATGIAAYGAAVTTGAYITGAGTIGFIAGWTIGSGINDVYESFSGESLGEDIYDWFLAEKIENKGIKNEQ